MPSTSSHRPGSRRRVLLVACVGYFLVLLDVTVVNVALPALGRDLAASLAQLQWVVDGYAVALAALLLAAGTLGDLRGHRTVVLAGLGLFGLASLACGLAPTPGVLVAGRVLQGIGAALLLPGTLAIVGRAFPDPRERARAIGVWAGVGSVALPAGPLLGGLLVGSVGWRAVFLLNVPIVLAAGAATARVVPGDRGLSGRRLDVPGTVLAGLTLAAFTFAVVEAGHSGLRPPAVVAAVVAAVACAAFLVRESTATEPMLPLRLFRRPAFTVANGVAGVMNFGTLGLLFLLTLHLQSVQHRGALAAGMAMLPLFLPLSVLAPLAGGLTARVGARPVAAAGLIVAAAGTAAVAGWTEHTGYAAIWPALLAWGVGLGLLTPAVVAAAVAAVPADRCGLASGVNNATRQAAGAVGIALYGAIAGPPESPDRFLAGLHVAALLTAALFATAAVAALVWLGGRPGRS